MGNSSSSRRLKTLSTSSPPAETRASCELKRISCAWQTAEGTAVLEKHSRLDDTSVRGLKTHSCSVKPALENFLAHASNVGFTKYGCQRSEADEAAGVVDVVGAAADVDAGNMVCRRVCCISAGFAGFAGVGRSGRLSGMSTAPLARPKRARAAAEAAADDSER